MRPLLIQEMSHCDNVTDLPGSFGSRELDGPLCRRSFLQNCCGQSLSSPQRSRQRTRPSTPLSVGSLNVRLTPQSYFPKVRKRGTPHWSTPSAPTEATPIPPPTPNASRRPPRTRAALVRWRLKVLAIHDWESGIRRIPHSSCSRGQCISSVASQARGGPCKTPPAARRVNSCPFFSAAHGHFTV